MERLRTRATIMKLAAAALLAAAPACGGPNEPAATNGSLPPASEPAEPAEPARPVALEGEALERTQRLFNAVCATCHLRDGTGDPHHDKDAIPDFTDRSWQSGETDEEVRAAIAGGKGPVMPAFGTRLAPEQIDELVVYVRGFPDRPAEAAPPAPGPHRAHD